MAVRDTLNSRDDERPNLDTQRRCGWHVGPWNPFGHHGRSGREKPCGSSFFHQTRRPILGPTSLPPGLIYADDDATDHYHDDEHYHDDDRSGKYDDNGASEYDDDVFDHDDDSEFACEITTGDFHQVGAGHLSMAL